MYAGHFAFGLSMKAKEPRVPTWILLVGVGFLDVCFGIFVPLGVERVTLTPHVSPGFSLDYIDWSHSLLMSLVWAVLFGLCFYGRGKLVAIYAGIAVFSHFVLDLLMHPHDLALWPGSHSHVGLGLWTVIPKGWWWFELGFIAFCCSYYLWKSRSDDSFGRNAQWASVLIVLLHVANAPWLKG